MILIALRLLTRICLFCYLDKSNVNYSSDNESNHYSKHFSVVIRVNKRLFQRIVSKSRENVVITIIEDVPYVNAVQYIHTNICSNLEFILYSEVSQLKPILLNPCSC